MPVYTDVEPCQYYPKPEEFFRRIHKPLGIRSVLSVGAGHGGPLDVHYWATVPLEKKEACDIFWIRDLPPYWTSKVGVDVQELTKFYPEKSFDLVECCETLEHVPNTRKALEELCKVARKLVFITSADETQHVGPEQEAIEKVNKCQAYIAQPKVQDLKDLGFEVRIDHMAGRQIIAWRIF